MRFNYKSKEYNEGYEAFLNGIKTDWQDKDSGCPYKSGTSQFDDWYKGFDDAEIHFNHNAGGDW